VTLEGSVLCFGGETLSPKWKISPELLSQDLPASRGPLRIDLVQRAQATDVIKGIFLGKDDVFSVFPQKICPEAFNPDVLVLLSTCLVDGRKMRHLHILALPAAGHGMDSVRQSVLQIYVMPLPSQEGLLKGRTLYRLDTPSGSLFELSGEQLASYTLAGGIPRLQNKAPAPGTTSFLRLSNSSLLVSTRYTIDVYNPLFRSLQASVPLDIPQSNGPSAAEANQDTSLCSFVAYFSRLEVAVAIVGKSLVATQLEPPRNRSKKRRADGLLIDSIGRGIPRWQGMGSERAATDVTGGSKFFSTLVPGSMSDEYWERYNADSEAADAMLSSGDVAGFERLIASRVGVKVDDRGTRLTNGHHHSNDDSVGNGTSEGNADLPEWLWPETGAEYPEVDRRWIMFALSRLFSWSDSRGAASDPRLACRLTESNVLNYLADSGHLSIPNLKSALRGHFQDADDNVDHLLGEELPALLVGIDPTMELLLTWLYATQLGAVELLTATRLLMQSLELVQDPTKMAPKLLTFPSADSHEDSGADAAENGEFGMELDRLEQQLQITEYYLGDETGTRARALSVAFGKLGNCPAGLVIQGLRRQLKPDEILSLIYVLRMELVKDGWTSRYLDTTRLDEDDDLEPPPDGSIQLLADLLCRCIDAVGPGGWLINDAILAAGNSEHLDSSDFLKALTHEVSAALEGVQEAAYLRGILNETIKYGTGVQRFLAQKGSPADQAREAIRARPVTLRANDVVSQMLPLGLKAPVGPARHEDITPTKVVSGGEVVKRSKREFGHLTSKKVGPYTLERIVI